MQDMQWLWWLVAALAFGVIEILTLDLIFAMLAVGAVGAALASLAGVPFVWCLIIFAVIAGIMIFAVRPMALRALRRAPADSATNSEGLVGRTGVVTQAVDQHTGRIKLHGDVWTARTLNDNEFFDVDQEVLVAKIDGATAVVTDVLKDAGAEPEDAPQRRMDGIPGSGDR